MKKLYIFTIIKLVLSFFGLIATAFSAGAYYTLLPLNNTYYVGDIFTVNVLISTGGEDTDSGDVILYYEPEFLEVEDALPAVPGVNVMPGTIYQAYPGNMVDTTNGKITITAFSVMAPYNSGLGTGVFATITFKALKVVDFTPVNFDFIPIVGDFYDQYVFGTSQDCNIAKTGSSADILSSVINGGYKIIPDEKPPYITDFNPPNNATNVSPSTNITFHVKDDETGVDLDSLRIDVNGQIYTKNGPLQFTYTGNKYDYAITINPPVNFDYNQLIQVNIDAKDVSNNAMTTYHSQFTTGPPPVNGPPKFDLISDKRIVAGETLNFIVKASDPNGDILTFLMENAPAGATLVKKTNEIYLFTWTPQESDIGTVKIDFTVSDNGSPKLSDSTSANIEVIPPPEKAPAVLCPSCPVCGERTECSDNRDNDNDGIIDYPNDPQCKDYYDNSEVAESDMVTQVVLGAYDYTKNFIFDSANNLTNYIKAKFRIAVPVSHSSFSLSPSTGSFYVGQKFSVNILINTDNIPSNGADVVLSYDSDSLEVLDSMPAQAGTQIKPGSVYEVYIANIVNPTAGEIKVTAFSVMGNYNSGTGNGVFATIDFLAKKEVSPTDVIFDFTLGSTIDTNIAEAGTGDDILSAVADGSYSIIPDATPPAITNFDPVNGSINRPVTQDVSFHVKDNETDVDIDSVKVRVNDVEYKKGMPQFIYSGGTKDYAITLALPSFAYSDTVNVYIDAEDTSNNTMSTYNSVFHIMEMPLNHAPTLDSISDVSFYENTDLSFIVTGSDPDLTDNITFTIENFPLGAQIFGMQKGEALFSWRTLAAGTYYATVKITDNGDPLMFDNQIVTITVKPYLPEAGQGVTCGACSVCPECMDQIDNDSDGKIDYPADPGCESPEDNDEADILPVPQCSDGIDNDNDGKIDYPADQGCESAADNDEIDILPTLPQCSDGIDNDNDGLIDYPADPGCENAAENDERDIIPKLPQCSDGIDNDYDGKIDYPADPGCESGLDDDETDLLPIIGGAVNEFLTQLEDLTINNPIVEKVNDDYGIPLLAAITIASVLSAISLGNFLIFLQFLITEPLRALIVIARKKWGVVYNSIDKKPIDLAIVRIYRSRDNKLISSRVTDKDGRYSFVVDPDKYYITVSKEEYLFPTKILAREIEDEKYIDLYHGEEIVVDEDDTLIVLNIPLDPEKEVERPAKLIFYHYFRKLQYLISFSGLIISFIVLMIEPNWLFLGLFILHVTLFILFRRLARPVKPKGFGVIYDKGTKNPLNLAVARIFDVETNKLMDSTVTDGKGRYSFLAGTGKFYISAEKNGYIPAKSKEIDLTKEEEAVLNVNLGIEKLTKEQKKAKVEQEPLKPEETQAPQELISPKPVFQVKEKFGEIIDKTKEIVKKQKEKIEYYIEKSGKLSPRRIVLEEKEVPITRTVEKLMGKEVGFSGKDLSEMNK